MGGRLFASSDAVVAGFACRQDLSQLRLTPCPRKHHWFSSTTAVIDLKDYVADPCAKVGLSRCCEFYLGKPLDKSEQCSLWSRRPLSDEQRAYAALDAHVCALIYLKIGEKRDCNQHQHSVSKKAKAS